MCFISCMVCYFFGLIGAAACTDAHCLFSCELLHVSLPTVCFDMTCCAYHCLSFVLIWPVCIFVCLMFWYDLLRVSLLIFYSDRSCGVCMCPYFFLYEPQRVPLSTFCFDISFCSYHCPSISLGMTCCEFHFFCSMICRLYHCPWFVSYCLYHFPCFVLIWYDACIIVNVLLWYQLLLVSFFMFCCDISCLYHCPCFVVMSVAACIIVHVLLWYQLPPVSLSMFCCDISCRLYHCPCFVVISAAACIIVHVLLWYRLPLASLSMPLFVSLSMFYCDIGYCLYHCPCFVVISAAACTIVHVLAISATACIIVHALSWYQLPLVSLSMFCCDIGYCLYHCPWASCQIRKNTGYAYAGNVGNVFPTAAG